MRSFIVALCFTMTVCCSVFAAHHTGISKQHEKRVFMNPITINNFAPYDIAFKISGTVGGKYYKIKKGATMMYNTSLGDTRATLYVAACTEWSKDGSVCLHSTIHERPEIYNAELIKTIYIKSALDSSVICLDGGMVSCIVK